ncbi:P-loop containing nucleoside triphosphate hydrolase [Abortiporus biennis]
MMYHRPSRLSYEMSDNDPLTALMAPPADETPEQRISRLEEEAEAKRISDAIDEGIKAEKAARNKRRKGEIRMLLLGQSESGKSTTLKNIQLTFAPNAWAAERASWRTVIQLNLVRSVNAILDALNTEMQPLSNTPSISAQSSTPGLFSDSEDSSDSDSFRSRRNLPALKFTSNHSLLKLRLTPLKRVEVDLKKFLGARSDELMINNSSTSTSFDINSTNEEPDTMMATPFDKTSYNPNPCRRPKEFTVRSHSSWKLALRNATGHRPTSPSGNDEKEGSNEVIAGCGEDMKALWNDSVVREVVKRRRVKLDDSAEYFLNNIDRITARDYEPSDNDVLRARLRTLGVHEYRLVFENTNVGREWIIYDVGGSRTTRSAWLPYFEDAHAILFLAPISCFNEHLAEDPKVNRLQDSFVLWKSIVSAKLLADCAIILFMNKYDLLEKKLKSGVQINHYLTSYGDRDNEAGTFSKYLRTKFKEIMRENAPKPRMFYAFTTSVIDKKATAATLASVRDGILREHLKRADFV